MEQESPPEKGKKKAEGTTTPGEIFLFQSNQAPEDQRMPLASSNPLVGQISSSNPTSETPNFQPESNQIRSTNNSNDSGPRDKSPSICSHEKRLEEVHPQEKAVMKSEKEELMKIFTKFKISEELVDLGKECLQEGDYKTLYTFVEEENKLPYRRELDQLIWNIENKCFSYEERKHQITTQFKSILQRYRITEEKIKVALRCFEQRNYKVLIKFPEEHLKKSFMQQVEVVREKNQKNQSQKNLKNNIKASEQEGDQVSERVSEVAREEFKAAEREQKIDQELNVEKQLRQICCKCQIVSEQRLKKCLQLFQNNDIQYLKDIPDDAYKSTFEILLDNLLRRVEEKVPKFDPVRERNKIFQAAKIHEPQSVKHCLQLFQSGKINQLKEYPSKLYTKQFSKSLDILLQKMQKHQKELFRVEYNIQEQEFSTIVEESKSGNFEPLLNVPQQSRKKIIKYLREKQIDLRSNSMEVQLRLSLCPLLPDAKIQMLLGRIKSMEELEQNLNVMAVVRDIQKQFQIEVKVFYGKDRNKIVRFNQLILEKNHQFLKQQIEIFLKGNFEDSVVFMDNRQVKLEQLEWKAKETYCLQVYTVREYQCVYKGKSRSIKLLPENNLAVNKQTILEDLLRSDLILQDKLSFSLQNLKVKFKIKNKMIEQSVWKEPVSIANIEDDNGKIQIIFIEVMLQFVLYYEDYLQIYTNFSSETTLRQFKTMLNEKYVPFDYQILSIIRGGETKVLQKIDPDQCISRICSSHIIVFELSSQESTEFYAFHRNYPLTFEMFAECFIEDEKQIQHAVLSFPNKKIEIEERFNNQLFKSIFSGIKKRFSIKSILNKYRTLLNNRFEQIWTPKQCNSATKVNESFVLAYMLHNADPRLKIEIMNLQKDKLPIPLYMKPFDNIFSIQNTLKLNNELLWILPKGFTIASIGWHNQNNLEKEKGKSSLLNYIFSTQFEEYQNKQPIIQGLPYLSIRVFSNLFPLHVIDIPHDCVEKISHEILQSSNLILIHSWKTQEETESELKRFKRQYKNIPLICLHRDSKEKIDLKDFRDKKTIQNEQIKKVLNYSEKTRSVSELQLLKEEIFKFIKSKFAGEKLDKIYGLFKQNEVYLEFSKIIEKVEKKMLSLTLIGDSMIKLKNQRDQNKRKLIQEEMKKNLAAELNQILLFMTNEKINSYQSLVLSLFRQKIKTFHHEINIKLVNIYKYIKLFTEKIKNIKNVDLKKQQISKIDQKLKDLLELRPKSLEKKSDQQIEEILTQMKNCYENQVYPRIFSMELFWRELNYLISMDHNFSIGGKKLLHIATELKKTEINNNLPFEIIDGDLLEIPRELMKELFQLRQDRAIVLTIMGPQSSGKSTLLNFLFGCDFATSMGRCTRGVYGTYFKFGENRTQFNRFNNCEGIFILDTEGIFGITNETDKKYKDRRDFNSKLILFCLAVSDFVVLNVAGNLDTNVEMNVRLCHQKLQRLNIPKDLWPELIVVSNKNNSSRQDESQIEFNELKNNVRFAFSRSLSQAYKIENFTHEQISLLQKNQVYQKNYPQQAFLKQTNNLLNEILKLIEIKKGVSSLAETIGKFDRTWKMVIQFETLSKLVTKQYETIEKQIKMLTDELEEKEQIGLDEMYEQFQDNKISEKQIIEEIKKNQEKSIILFDQKFKEEDLDDNEIKLLKRQQKFKIKERTKMVIANAQYELESIKLKKYNKVSSIQGDYNLNQLARAINREKKTYSDKQLRKKFNNKYDQILSNIEKTINRADESQRQYEKIRQSYEFLILSRTKDIGLPIERQWIGNDKCSLEEMKQIIRNKILSPKEEKFGDTFEYTQKIYVNLLMGGKTDASLQYFNMKDYFFSTEITECYGLTSQELSCVFHKQKIQSMIHKKVIEMRKKKIYHKKLKAFWDDINNSLSKINLEFTNFNRFVQFFEREESFYKDFLELDSNISDPDNRKIEYKFEKKSSKKVNKECGLKKRKQFFFSSAQQCSCEFSKYLIKRGKNGHFLCRYSENDPPNFLQQNFYHHINWKEIKKQIENESQLNLIDTLNDQITKEINKQLEKINIRIDDRVLWLQYFNQFRPKMINFKLVEKSKPISSADKIYNTIDEVEYIMAKQLKQRMKKQVKGEESSYPNFLRMFQVKNKKLEPRKKKSFFETYLKDNPHLTIEELKKQDIREFLFKEIKKKKSLEKLFDKVFEIVKSQVDCTNTIDNKNLSSIYNQVSQQIGKFNSDFNQISYNLSKEYIAFLNLSVVYMIWKISVDNKIQEKRKIYNDKQNEREKEWKHFQDIVSKDEKKNISASCKDFRKYFIKSVEKEIIAKQKKLIMKAGSQAFEKQNKRDHIQQLIDMEIFRNSTPAADILHYLEHPEDVIIKKYESCYETSWNKISSNYLTSSRTAKDILNRFYQIMADLKNIFDIKEVSQTKGGFNDLFQIRMDDLQMDEQSVLRQKYKEHGNRILFEYFIDIINSNNPNQIRKCANIKVQPKNKINFSPKIDPTLKNVLQEIKSIKVIFIVNIYKFINLILSERGKFSEELDRQIKLKEEDKEEYIKMIQVPICKAKCPCCGRICGYSEDGHPSHHQCLYGHQMRGLNGNYIDRGNGIKQASVIRCEQMADTDRIDYIIPSQSKKDQYLWAEFKQFFRKKKPGGWKFDDAILKNKKNEQNQQRFEQAWIIAGPIFCRKNNLKYVNYNSSQSQRQVATQVPLHYIFALDESGSMIGQKWAALLDSLGKTISKIIPMDNGRNLIKISIIKFNTNATLVCQNILPNQYSSLDITFSSGGTDFEPVFKLAAQISNKYIKQAKIIFIFMTDGQSRQPIAGITALKNLQSAYPKNFQYYGIEFETKVQVMSDIALKLKGKTGVAYTPEQLTEMYEKCIEVIQSREDN